MSEFLFYILKSAICLSVFYIFVKAFLSRDTFFHINRFVILLGTLACIVLPLVEVELTETMIIQKPISELKNIIVTDTQNEVTPLNVIEENEENHFLGSTIPWALLVFVIYLLGVFVNIFLVLKSYLSMLSVMEKGKGQKYGKYILLLTDKNVVPFSWMRCIVLSRTDYAQSANEILIHEVAHIKYRHVYDNCFMELISLLQWFNPAIWLLKRELKDVHEYQADMRVLESGIDATKYQLLLVKKAVGVSSYTLANSFNHSKIKKRITMMLKEKSKSGHI